MKRAKKRKQQAKTLTTNGVGIIGGIAIGSALMKFLAHQIIEAFADPDDEAAPKVEVSMEAIFESMNVFLGVLIAGRHHQIVAVRPAKRDLKLLLCPFRRTRRKKA